MTGIKKIIRLENVKIINKERTDIDMKIFTGILVYAISFIFLIKTLKSSEKTFYMIAFSVIFLLAFIGLIKIFKRYRYEVNLYYEYDIMKNGKINSTQKSKSRVTYFAKNEKELYKNIVLDLEDEYNNKSKMIARVDEANYNLQKIMLGEKSGGKI